MVSKKSKRKKGREEESLRFTEQLDLVSGYVPTGDYELTGGYVPTGDYEFTGSYVSTGDYELTGGYVPTGDYEFTGSYVPTGDYLSSDMINFSDESEESRILNDCFEELQNNPIFLLESFPQKQSSPKGYIIPPII